MYAVFTIVLLALGVALFVVGMVMVWTPLIDVGVIELVASDALFLAWIFIVYVVRPSLVKE